MQDFHRMAMYNIQTEAIWDTCSWLQLAH